MRILRRFRMNVITVHAAILTLSAACVPYTVATTAQPVKPGESIESMAITVMPEVGTIDTSRGSSFLSLDGETRRGIDSVSDWGIRFVSFSGIVANYKRLLTAPDDALLMSFIGGAGFVNLGNHAHFEATLVISPNENPPAVAPSSGVINAGRTAATMVPYAGLRVMQVAPLNIHAVHDKPTTGGFVGARFGRQTLGVSLEVGFFHDPSALEVRSNDFVIVPAVVVHGRELLEMLRPPRIPGGRFPIYR